MALFGFACPLCSLLLLIISFTIYIQYNSSVNEKFTSAERYFPSRCTHLDYNNCLQTSGCGWLVDGDYTSRCLQGTPVGPTNPKLQPDAENSRRGNIQNDRWIYSHQNPFIFC